VTSATPYRAVRILEQGRSADSSGLTSLEMLGLWIVCGGGAPGSGQLRSRWQGVFRRRLTSGMRDVAQAGQDNFNVGACVVS